MRNVNLYFKRTGTKPIGTSHIFYVKLKTPDDLPRLLQAASDNDLLVLEQVPYMPLWYKLKLNPRSGETLQKARRIWGMGLFDTVDPNFLFDFSPAPHSSQYNPPATTTTCANDPAFGALWGFYNAANPNIDINACDAWTISEGAGIKVAVVDGSGIEMTHNDLAANIHPESYNMETF